MKARNQELSVDDEKEEQRFYFLTCSKGEQERGVGSAQEPAAADGSRFCDALDHSTELKGSRIDCTDVVSLRCVS